MKNISINKNRLITSVIASIYFIYYWSTYTEWHFIDNVNLIIHEAGHFIFAFFGEFIHLLGGSIFQVLIPVVFVIYFYRRYDYFSASLLLFWVGQNLLNVSVYVSDAVVMQLPLLGGNSSIHDWNSLLQMLGVLNYTEIIGTIIYITGAVIIVCAIYFSLVNSISKKEDKKL